MRQILAIVAKDARRFWPEVLVCFALLIALLLVYPATWRMDGPFYGFSRVRFFGESPIGVLASCVVVLVPIAWLVLIARVIHCERLVGDTQFWLTRPYDWRKLFVAKLLFLAAFLYLPFFIAQCVLLREGGFHPFHYLGGLLFNLLLLTAVGVMPVLALGTITRGFARLLLVLLGVILVIAAAVVGNSVMPSYATSSVPDILSGYLAIGAIFCGSLTVAIVMYARHSTKTGWLVLLALTLLMCSTAFFDPDSMLVDRSYPELTSGSATPVKFAYDDGENKQPGASLSGDERSIDIAIPMQASGVQEGNVAIPQTLKAVMRNSNGARWESTWQGFEPQRFLPGVHATWIRFRMRRSVYQQFKASPVTLSVSIATTVARRSSESVIPLALGDFVVPEIGVCKPTPWMLSSNDFMGIACRSAMNEPQLTYVSVPFISGSCSAGASVDRKQLTTDGWVGGLDPGPAEFGVTSVWDAQVNLSRPGISYPEADGARWNLCEGAPMRFTQYVPAARLRETLTISNFHLPELAIGDKLMFIRPR